MPDDFGAAFLRSKKDAGSRIRTCVSTKEIGPEPIAFDRSAIPAKQEEKRLGDFKRCAFAEDKRI